MSGSILILALAAVLAIIIGLFLWVRLWRQNDVGDDLYPETANWTILRPSKDSKSGLSTAGIIAVSGLFSGNGSSGDGGSGGSSCNDGGSAGSCS